MPSQKKWRVRVAGEDGEAVVRVTRTGVHPASVIRRARLLLALDTAVGAVEDRVVIAEQAGVSCETVRLVSKRFAETGGDVWATVERKKREFPPVPSQVTGEVEAKLIALACSAPPPRHAPWPLRLLQH